MSATWRAIADRLPSPLAKFLARAVAGTRGRDVVEFDFARYQLLVASLFSSPTSVVLSNVVGTAVPFFCWSATGMPAFLLLGVAAAITIALRVVTIIGYRRADHSHDDLATVKRWDREYLLGSTVFSAILGYNAYVALALTDNVPSHIINIIAGIAFSSGYVARNAGRPVFVIVQLLFFCVPMALGLFSSPQLYYRIIGVFVLLYIVTNIAITFSINRNLLALAAANKKSQSLAQTLRRKNITLDSALNSMTHGLAMFDAELQLEVANSKFSELYSLPEDLLVPGTQFRHVINQLILAQTFAPDPANDLAAVCDRVLHSQQPATLETFTERQQTFVISIEPTPDAGILMLTEDATARKAIAAQIERMAHYDSLTGLANRFKFNGVLKEACVLAETEGRPFSLLYIDLDNFKNINDSLGHDAGDHLLVATAQRLRDFLGEDVVARIGGDEFVLVQPATAAPAAVEMGQRIVDIMSTPFEIDGTTIYVTTSVGVALAPEHGSQPADVLRAADIALYAAKAAGRNTVAMFDPTMADALNKRREIENDLREACQTGRLFLYYQPIISLATSHIDSCEALMRWQHPTKGMIPPNVFIPIAEQSGLIAQMGDWAIRQACMEATNWPDQISVSVNVSAFQFKDTKRLIDTVKDALLISRLAPNRLELEVTETLLIEDQKTTLEAIRALRRIGVRFSLDDFGTGYSSLAYLARYPFSKVKIDRGFAQHVTTAGPSRSIIEAVCQLARRLGLRVVVEGIETEEQKREIELLGAEQAQGYLFGRPEPAETLMPRLTRAA
ncbi:MAG TPA: EAL domain-containing protein [Xanthobacteraceae bacterium]